MALNVHVYIINLLVSSAFLHSGSINFDIVNNENVLISLISTNIPYSVNTCSIFIFSGSSLDLTPTLLSIYDSIASGSTVSSDGQADKETSSQLPETGQLANKSTPPPSSKVKQSRPGLKNSNKMETQKPEDVVQAELDSKKRPLSVSSSASSSSLPRHSNKRQNLAGPEHEMGSQLDIEKLDNLMFIDDEDSDHCPKTANDVSESDPVEMVDGDISGNYTIISNDGSCVEEKGSITNFQMELEPNCCSDSISVSPIPVHSDQNLKNRPVDTSPVVYTSKQNLQLSPVSTHRVSTSELSPPMPVGPICKLPCATSTPQTSASTKQSQYISHGQRVVTEIVDTERTYVRNLNEIKEVSSININSTRYVTEKVHCSRDQI